MLHRGRGGFYLLVAGAFAFLILPRLAQPGMFVDGVTYASISRNLALGIGRFWAPSYTATLYPVFDEHPPLAFALEGIAFAVFGDHLAVERAYAVLMGASTAVLIMAIWRRTVGERAFDWLPVVFWLLPSTVTWAIVNNLLETTQAVFTTLAVLAVIRAVQSARSWLAWTSGAAAAIVCAILAKGPVGLFPIATPFVAAVMFPAARTKGLRVGAALLVMLGLAAAGMWTIEPARVELTAYLHQQLVPSITGARGGDRWASLARHLAYSIVLRMSLLLIAGVLLAHASGVREPRRVPGRWSFFFFGLALCASLPMAASARIMGHYLVPSVPLFALGFAALTADLLRAALVRWLEPGSKAPGIAAIAGSVLLVAAVALPLGRVVLEPRDAEWIAEYRALAPHLSRGIVAGTCHAAGADWGAQAYLQRFFRISLDADSRRAHREFIQFKDRPCRPAPDCHPVASTARLALLACDGAGVALR